MSAATPVVRTTKSVRRLSEWSFTIFTLITSVYCNDPRNDSKALHVFSTQLLTLPGSTEADDAHPGSELSRGFFGVLGSLKQGLKNLFAKVALPAIAARRRLSCARPSSSFCGEIRSGRSR